MITALAPVLGYAEAAALAKEALRTNEPVADLVVERGLLGAAELAELLQPARLAGLTPEAGEVETLEKPVERPEQS